MFNIQYYSPFFGLFGHDNLIDAVTLNDYAAVEKLLQNGSDPNLPKDYYNRSPLHLAVIYKSYDLIRLLLNAGATLKTISTKYGHTTALMSALKDLSLVNLILEYVNEPNYINIPDVNNGNTIIHYLVYRMLYKFEQEHGEIFKLLIDKGGDVNALNYRNETPLMFAAHPWPIDIDKQGLYEVISAGADFNAFYRNGDSLLSQIANYNIDNEYYHITYYADENFFVKKFGEHKLRMASVKNKIILMKFLIENKAIFNPALKLNDDIIVKRDHDPLIVALKNGYLKVFDILLENDTDPNAFADQGICTLLIYAIRKGLNYTAKKLIAYDAYLNSALVNAIDAENQDIVEFLIEIGVNVNEKGVIVNFGSSFEYKIMQSQYTPLFKAVEKDNLKLVKVLIDNGANVKDTTDDMQLVAKYLASNNPYSQYTNWQILFKSVIEKHLNSLDSVEVMCGGDDILYDSKLVTLNHPPKIIYEEDLDKPLELIGKSLDEATY